MRMCISNRALTPEVIAFFYSTIKELYSYFVAAEALEWAIGMGTQDIMHAVSNGGVMVLPVLVVLVCTQLFKPKVAAETKLTCMQF